jgi:hypothetical protein
MKNKFFLYRGNLDVKESMKKIHSHTFRGQEFKISWRKPRASKELNLNEGDELYGVTDNSAKKITINPKLEDKQLLQTAIDEGIHATIWDLDNESVAEIAKSISNFLWKIGYRLEKKG